MSNSIDKVSVIRGCDDKSCKYCSLSSMTKRARRLVPNRWYHYKACFVETTINKNGSIRIEVFCNEEEHNNDKSKG